jgi:hypothetical protein
MNLIVATDILGNTTALNELVSQFSELYGEISIVDPYDGENIRFDHEQDAYQYFQQYCGLGQLTEKLKQEVVKSNDLVDIVGFSVGGSSAWEISGNSILNNIRKIVCFYGSRIRENIDISPNVLTKLVFPVLKNGFDLEPVIQTIENKQNVEVIRSDYLHGFMNKKSVNFSESGYQYFSKWFSKEAV